jgi:hypothetical protein
VSDRTARAPVFGGFNVDPELPWKASHLVATVAALGLGAVGVLVSWWAASGTARLSVEIAWMNLGVAALIVIGATTAVWVLAGRRVIGHRQARLAVALEGVKERRRPSVPTAGSWEIHPASGVAAADAVAQHDRLVWAPGMTRYHREGCQLVQGKQVRVASLGAHEKAGRRPCGMCVSDGRSVS